MNFVSVELPFLRIPLSREALEFINAALYVFVASKAVEIIAHRLIQALSHDAGPFSGTLNDLLIGGKGNIHAHSMREPILHVNLTFEAGHFQADCPGRTPQQTRRADRWRVFLASRMGGARMPIVFWADSEVTSGLPVTRPEPRFSPNSDGISG